MTPSAETASEITLPAEMEFMITYRTIDAPPMTTVDTVGVRNLACTRAKAEGMAL